MCFQKLKNYLTFNLFGMLKCFFSLQSTFPSGHNLFHNTSAGYEKEWEAEPHAWAHPDSVDSLEDKIGLLSGNSSKYWKVVPEDPSPICKK